jgi:hypothetical protein
MEQNGLTFSIFEQLQSDYEISMYFQHNDLFTFVKKWLVVEKSITQIDRESLCITDTRFDELSDQIRNINTGTDQNRLLTSQLDNILLEFKDLKNSIVQKQNSHAIGLVAEIKLEKFLEDLFVDACITNVSGIPNCADIRYSAKNQSDILIDSKNYTGRAVSSNQGVDKLVKDLVTQNVMCGMLVCTGKVAGYSHSTVQVISGKIVGILPYHNYHSSSFILMVHFIQTLYQQIISSQKISDGINVYPKVYDKMFAEFTQINETFAEMLSVTEKNAKDFVRKFRPKTKIPSMSTFFNKVNEK